MVHPVQAELVRFAAFPGGRFFSGGAIILSPNNVLNQETMREKFGEKLLKFGIKKAKKGFRFARQARHGEKISKVEDGEVKSIHNVGDDDSWVIRQESVDRELYVLDYQKFRKNYKQESRTLISKIKNEALPESERAELDALERRGYERYERQGKSLIYFVTEEDMKEFVGDECEFLAPFSVSPLKFKAGIPLVTTYVENIDDMEDIYDCKNAKQIYHLQDADIEEQRKAQASLSAETSKVKESAPQAPEHIPPLTMLQNCMDKEAKEQANLLEHWYKKDKDRPKLRSSFSKEDLLHSCKTPLEYWMSGIPQNTHGLCVLFGGEKYLADAKCRDYLRKILQDHPNLCLLITVLDEEQDQLKHYFDEKSFKELPLRMTQIRPESAAQLYHRRINRKKLTRSDFGEDGDGPLTEKQVLEKLQKQPWLLQCEGRPGHVVRRADDFNAGKKSTESIIKTPESPIKDSNTTVPEKTVSDPELKQNLQSAIESAAVIDETLKLQAGISESGSISDALSRLRNLETQQESLDKKLSKVLELLGSREKGESKDNGKDAQHGSKGGKSYKAGSKGRGKGRGKGKGGPKGKGRGKGKGGN